MPASSGTPDDLAGLPNKPAADRSVPLGT